jgi:hypothetical protein
MPGPYQANPTKRSWWCRFGFQWWIPFLHSTPVTTVFFRCSRPACDARAHYFYGGQHAFEELAARLSSGAPRQGP